MVTSLCVTDLHLAQMTPIRVWMFTVKLIACLSSCVDTFCTQREESRSRFIR